jgi:glycosyltransferase 2 family protein
MKRHLSWLKRLLSVVILGAVGWLFWRSLSGNWHNIRDQQIRWIPHGLLALILFAAAVAASGYLWGKVLYRLTAKPVAPTEAIRIHMASWLLKYIPGQTGSFVSKLLWGKRQGISKSDITTSFVYENLFLTIASTVPTIPIVVLSIGNRTNYNLSLIFLLLLVVPLIISRPWTIRFGERLIFKLTKRPIKLTYLSLGEIVRYSLLFLGPRLLNGAGFVLIAASFLNVPADTFVPLGAIYALAGIIGIYAIFVPSGLGVREGVITLFLSAYYPTHQAVALALLARFYATVADGLVALLYVILTKRKP